MQSTGEDRERSMTMSSLSRRNLFRIGGVDLLSGGLLSLLASRGQASFAGIPKAKACILLFQVGGPYQCDTFDPKPSATEEVRGPYLPLATPVAGLDVTEALPLVAAQGDKFAVVRSVYHSIRCHNPAIYCTLVGREATSPLAVSVKTEASRTDFPHYASILSKFRPGTPSVPGHVILPDLVYNGPAKSPGLTGGYLGPNFDPLVLGSELGGEKSPPVDGVGLPDGVDALRSGSRRGLLEELDARQNRIEQDGRLETMDALYRRAFELMTSSRAKRAFDLEQEPAANRDRYGRHTMGQGALLARRLVEAGVPFVTVFSHTQVDNGSWDTHNKHDERSKKDLLPPADQSLSALLIDLARTGMLDDVLVIWMGEFGRTPRRGVQFSNNTNNVGGRDHWCNAYSVVMAGGGVKGGQVVGSSDRLGAYPKDRPVHISDLAATIYHAMGVDPRTQLNDVQGRLRFICDGQPVHELF